MNSSTQDHEFLLRSLSEHEERRSAPAPRYEIGERIGSGATADVHRAFDRALQRVVAIKLLRAGILEDRFRREARTLAQLAHPHVVQIFDVGTLDDRPYLAMELIEGRPAGSPLTLDLLEQAARGVGAAHERGIVHRDLKPGNILVTGTGMAKVADFGLAHVSEPGARLTRTGVPLGTPVYMAPEQVAGTEVCPATDVYALGAMLYEIATGHVPYEAESLPVLYAEILKTDPAKPRERVPSIPKNLEAVILKAMARDPQRRYATAERFAADLRRYLDGRPVEARPESAAGRVVRAFRRRSGLIVGSAVLLMVFGMAAWRVSSEQDAALTGLRTLAKMSLQRALDFRRVGAHDRMRQFLPKLEAAVEETVRRAPKLAEPEYLLGRMHRALMQEDRALEYQERALRKEPGHPGARYERAILNSREYGRRLRGSEADPDAMEQLKKSILEDCRFLSDAPLAEADRLAAGGILHYHLGRYEEALGMLQRAVAANPDLEEAWETYVLTVSRGAADVERIAALYTEGLSRDRGYLPFLVGRAQARTERARERRENGGDPHAELDLAEEDLGQALRGDPTYGPAWWARGITRTHRAIYRASLGEDPQTDCRAAMGDFSQQLVRTPNNPDALRRRGFARLQLAVFRRKQGTPAPAELAAAAADLEESLRLDSRHPQAWNWRGLIAAERAMTREDPQSEFAAAEKDFSEALRRRPGYADALKFRGLVKSARAAWLLERGGAPIADLDGADEDLRRALELQPLSSEASTARAGVRLLQARLGDREDRADLDRAESELTALLERNSMWADAWSLRGRVRFAIASAEESRGNAPSAREVLRAAVTDLRRAGYLAPPVSKEVQACMDQAVLALERLGE